MGAYRQRHSAHKYVQSASVYMHPSILIKFQWVIMSIPGWTPASAHGYVQIFIDSKMFKEGEAVCLCYKFIWLSCLVSVVEAWHNHCSLYYCGNMNFQYLYTWRKEIYWIINSMICLLTEFYYLKHQQESGFISYEYFSGN